MKCPSFAPRLLTTSQTPAVQGGQATTYTDGPTRRQAVLHQRDTTVQIIDSLFQEHSDEQRKATIRQADGFMLVFSYGDKRSLGNLRLARDFITEVR